MAFEAVVRKWGNSVGIVFPKDVVKSRGIKVDQKVVVEVTKKTDLKKVFGSLPRKMSGQEFKDMVREGWN
jgi:antitoxin component of MazEF toxin-antitoxin module